MSPMGCRFVVVLAYVKRTQGFLTRIRAKKPLIVNIRMPLHLSSFAMHFQNLACTSATQEYPLKKQIHGEVWWVTWEQSVAQVHSRNQR